MVPQPGQKPISSLAEISIGVHTSSFLSDSLQKDHYCCGAAGGPV
jgi:hypothetical protein